MADFFVENIKLGLDFLPGKKLSLRRKFLRIQSFGETGMNICEKLFTQHWEKNDTVSHTLGKSSYELLQFVGVIRQKHELDIDFVLMFHVVKYNFITYLKLYFFSDGITFLKYKVKIFTSNWMYYFLYCTSKQEIISW